MTDSNLLKTLRKQATQLQVVVMIGAKGLTDAVHDEIECALVAHELIKIRVTGFEKQDKQNMIQAMLERHQAQLVQQIGHVAVIYRPNPDKK